MKIRTYSELMQLPDFESRYEYLRLRGTVGKDTFGFDRIFYEMFLKSGDWKTIRNQVILRDNGCDLGIKGREIVGPIYIHHMNPVCLDDIKNSTDILLNPEYLICVSHMTHNAIHYGNSNLLMKDPVERRPNDTCPWKK